ncbi:putative 1-phosphatidylinositol-3-phosphate 5-kinase FAB1C [Sesamum angolense]|uniref:1-phosphatidylinositol-3-phosphate 5-kinase n=1 Tax=Sesamum angolense TaxID=2727404 RepID=A0AAE1XDA1_9LAMI|nr:putative 1-phosphatidylinositol-3-phosphate 5-kinase FAB1C [Sesamum angolense]
MMDKKCSICCHCKRNILESYLKYQCQSCRRLLCGDCVQGHAFLDEVASSHLKETTEAIFYIKLCKLCSELGPLSKSGRRCSGKVYPSDSPRQSREPPAPSFSGERADEFVREDSTNHFFSAPSEYFHDVSDVDSSSFSARHVFYSYMSVGSSPSDSPSRLHMTSSRVGHSVQLEQGETPSSQTDGPFNQEQAVLERPDKGIWGAENADDLSISQHKSENSTQPWDFETNGFFWFPPPPDDVNDEVENNLFTNDDEDDEVGNSGLMLFPPASIDSIFLAKEKQPLDNKDPWRAVIEGHFRALVSQLLQGQGIRGTKDNCAGDWLDIVAAIAWQAAKFIKPDTSKGGSMDPCEYLKVKCVASGSPSQSKLVKGVVCTKNIKHKRMMSQYKNARLLLLGGALEYQRIPNQLASFETLLQQENDHLKAIVSKIEAHRPNVLLVEKSVSSFALEHLLAKEISLVLNVKRPLLERIARCSGASIIPSTDHISTARLGHCELFHLEKVSEDHEPLNQFNKKPLKTLMFLEGCPRRLGCTVVLRGSHREELKKVKHVVQYAVFAAHHLSLETSFLADEGASLPKVAAKPSCFIPEKMNPSMAVAVIPDTVMSFRFRKALSEACDKNLAKELSLHDLMPACPRIINHTLTESLGQEEGQSGGVVELAKPVKVEDAEGSSEYFSANDTHQSILVSFSSHCMVNGTSYLCRSCKESAEAHVICYTHQHANLTINVRRLPSVKLPGEQDGKIWMWHRCLRCTHIGGVPPATRRVVMSDAAWGLSFGKFLELSFSNHATGNRVASCGHSLQRDCLRFYGFGSMVAFFRYCPINILSVRLPPSVLEFGGPCEQSWIRKEAYELLSKARALYAEISRVLEEVKSKCSSSIDEFADASELHNHVLELNSMLSGKKSLRKPQLMIFYKDMLQLADKEIPEQDQSAVDILEINRLRHSLLIGSHVWERRLYLLDSLLKNSSRLEAPDGVASLTGLKDCDTDLKDCSLDLSREDNMSEHPKLEEFPDEVVPSNNEGPNFSRLGPDLQENYALPTSPTKKGRTCAKMMGFAVNITSLERLPSAASILSDKIDSAWSGADQPPTEAHLPDSLNLDAARKNKERTSPSSLYLSALRSFHASGDYRHMVRDPVTNVQRTYSQVSPREAENSKEYEDWVAGRLNGLEGGSNVRLLNKVNSLASDLSTWHSFGSLDLDYTNYASYSSEDASATVGSLFADHSSSPHLRISFEDESSNAAGKVKFSVTCYFAKQFDALRRRCCPSEVDFLRSLSRCKRWSAQGGKSNVYFAKSFDDRFIIKQSNMKAGGKEVKMELMVMENLLYGKSISRVYDLKGSERSRYNSDTTGANKVLLDMNLLETLTTNPIFLGSKAKRSLERAVWNDTSFLASVDVMDYSLLVGVDEERKELVLGIIDFMRQYTWDKHLETWVKASGILGGPKNASPTIISPKQYKKRFRKAMTTYFLTVPDQ